KLKNVGYFHMGFAKDFHTYTQPRFNAEYRITDDEGRKLSDEDILLGFDKKIKKFIGRYTEERGIYFENSNSEEAVELFSQISEHTEERQHILLRDLNYFKRIRNSFKDDNVYFFAKMNLDKFIEFCDKQIKTQVNTDQAVNDIEAAREIKEKKGNIVTLAALLIIKSKDTAYLMYSGFDDNIFSRFRTTNQLRYEAMKYFRDKGCNIFSFMGVDGNLSDSLSDFKLKFNPYVV
ncbi:MAG: murM, partial [Clostridia bacterium]|nr:murM [Clostridia bacterium]